MTGSLFGPGGNGRPRRGRLTYDQIMVHNNTPAGMMYCQLRSITTQTGIQRRDSFDKISQTYIKKREL